MQFVNRPARIRDETSGAKKGRDLHTLVGDISGVTVDMGNGKERLNFGLKDESVTSLAQGNMFSGMRNTKDKPSRTFGIKNNAYSCTMSLKVSANPDNSAMWCCPS